MAHKGRSAVAALQKGLGIVRERNEALNALVFVDETGAQRAAQASDRRRAAGNALSPVDGMTLAVKANVAVKGWPWTAALTPFKDRIAEWDAPVVAALRNAGVVLVGLANMHEAALGATTVSPLYGQAFHPDREGFTPGGSSGGSAAAVAAGMVEAAIGTDTMGSVRIPSSYCGIAGIKPSAGRIPRDGVELLSWALDHVGFHARSVVTLRRLIAAVPMQALEGPFGPLKRYKRVGSLAQIRVGILESHGVAVPGSVSSALERAVKTLRGKVAKLRRIAWPGQPFARLRRRGLFISEAEFAAGQGEQLDRVLDQVSPTLRGLVHWGANQPAVALVRAYSELAAARRTLESIFEAVNVLLLPTAPQAAFAVSGPHPDNQADLTVLANISGVPAVTVPMGADESGLPLGLQILAPRGADALALSLAQALESAFKESAEASSL